MRKALLPLALLAALMAAAAGAVHRPELARNRPVALVAGVSGEASIQYPGEEWRRCHALDLLRPEVQLKTGGGGQITVIFLYDDHREIVPADSQASTAFRSLNKVAGTVRREPSRSGGSEFEVPYVMAVKLTRDRFAHADDPHEMEHEEDFLSAYVEVTSYPPIFHWRDLKSPGYRLQLFNEWDQFIFETSVSRPLYRFPYRPPFRLMKSGQYYWQVLTPDNQVAVRKYGFQLLTKPLVREVTSEERAFAAEQKKHRGEPTSFAELFLVYNQYHTLDKLVHHLQLWRDADPQNPNVYRYLTRAYLLRGCPLRAREALAQAEKLGASDPLGE